MQWVPLSQVAFRLALHLFAIPLSEQILIDAPKEM